MFDGIVRDCFGRYFKIQTQAEQQAHLSISPERFSDFTLARIWVENIRLSEFQWRNYLPFSSSTLNQGINYPDRSIKDQVSRQLITGGIRVYALPDSIINSPDDKSGTGRIVDENKISYIFRPSSILLITKPEEYKVFNNKNDALSFLTGLKVEQKQIEEIELFNGLCEGVGTSGSSERLDKLADEMAKGKIIVIIKRPVSSTPSTTGNTDSSEKVTSQKAELGPHGDSYDTNKNSFKSQDDAARHVSKSINPTSVKENREYGGMIYQNQDGTYGYTGPFKGSIDGVDPGGPNSVPNGTKAVAYYHTHGGDDPMYDNENFSNIYDPVDKKSYGDIPYAEACGVDGYLATPKGKFKRYSVNEKQVYNLGDL